MFVAFVWGASFGHVPRISFLVTWMGLAVFDVCLQVSIHSLPDSNSEFERQCHPSNEVNPQPIGTGMSQLLGAGCPFQLLLGIDWNTSKPDPYHMVRPFDCLSPREMDNKRSYRLPPTETTSTNSDNAVLLHKAGANHNPACSNHLGKLYCSSQTGQASFTADFVATPRASSF